ncbi:MAG: peptidase [Actinobacteria bacterium]|nr:peptidase [Actinomycetota bacterium]
MLVRTALLIAAVASAAISFPAAAAEADGDSDGHVGIRLVDIPAERFEDPRARLYIIDHVAPGTTIERRVEVTNTTGSELQLGLSVGAAAVSDGSFHSVDDDPASPIVGWATVTPDQVSVPAGEARETTVRIDVPPTAEDGEYYAAIWAEPPSAQVGATTVVNRVGIRVYLSIGEGAEPLSDFSIDDLVASRTSDGAPAVDATLTNRGGRALDISGELLLSDGPGGVVAGPFTAEPGTSVGVGQTARMTFHLDPELPAGPWLAEVVARSGLIERAAEATIEFPDDAGESAAAVDATEVPLHQDRGVLVPLALGLLVLALFLVLLVWFLAKRRREDEDEDAEDASTDQPVGTTS